MHVAPTVDKTMLVRMADQEGIMLAIKCFAFAIRTAIGTAVTTAITARTQSITTAFNAGCGDQTAGRQPAIVANRRSPAIHLAIMAAIKVMTRRGTARAVARPKSYKAANAVKTSVVKTRIRSKPGTPNSATERANTRR